GAVQCSFGRLKREIKNFVGDGNALADHFARAECLFSARECLATRESAPLRRIHVVRANAFQLTTEFTQVTIPTRVNLALATCTEPCIFRRAQQDAFRAKVIYVRVRINLRPRCPQFSQTLWTEGAERCRATMTQYARHFREHALRLNAPLQDQT